MEEVLNALLLANETRERAMASLLRIIVDNVDKVIEELFGSHPELTAIKWTQFMSKNVDGEEALPELMTDGILVLLTDDAVARVRNVDGIVKVRDAEKTWLDWDCSDGADVPRAIRHVYNIFRALSDDIYKEKWGYPVQVMITRGEEGLISFISPYQRAEEPASPS